jgi:predicted ArsR family transcriptional regulator
MAKSKETTVITSMDNNSYASLPAEDRMRIARELLASLNVTEEMNILSERRDTVAAKLDAEKSRISAEIDQLHQEIAPRNERIKVLMAELRNLGLKPDSDTGRTRIVNVCEECGAKSHHVEGENGTRCATYAALMEDKAKDEKLTSVARQKYAERAAVVRQRITEAA